MAMSSKTTEVRVARIEERLRIRLHLPAIIPILACTVNRTSLGQAAGDSLVTRFTRMTLVVSGPAIGPPRSSWTPSVREFRSLRSLPGRVRLLQNDRFLAASGDHDLSRVPARPGLFRVSDPAEAFPCQYDGLAATGSLPAFRGCAALLDAGRPQDDPDGPEEGPSLRPNATPTPQPVRLRYRAIPPVVRRSPGQRRQSRGAVNPRRGGFRAPLPDHRGGHLDGPHHNVHTRSRGRRRRADRPA